jgi:hypothetical protein
MSSEIKQTAVEWYDNEIEKLFDQFCMQKINISEFETKQLELKQQAKEMEKEECIKFYIKGCEDTYGMDEGDDDRKDAERFYNLTYGGKK